MYIKLNDAKYGEHYIPVSAISMIQPTKNGKFRCHGFIGNRG